MIEPEFGRFLHSIIETLEQLELTYGIGGSVASSLYGEARSTLDVDISVVLPLDRVLDFTQAFQALGYYAFLDAVFDAIVARQPFNIIDPQSGYKADIFPIDADTPTPQEQEILSRLQRHIYDETNGAAAVLYSPEDVIVYKLKYYIVGRMPKHLRDIGAILAATGDALDRDYITRWADQLGAGDVWAELMAVYDGSER
jgi:hypothetical protein